MASLSFLLCISPFVLQTHISDAKSIPPLNAVNSSRTPGDRARHPVGDMLLNTEQWGHFLQRNSLGRDSLWPLNSDGIPEIYYMITDPSIAVEKFKLALSRWEEVTCAKFKELPNGDTSVDSYIQVGAEDGCMSGIGYDPGYPTYISLASDCSYPTMLHELGHAFSFDHEQKRTDRDDAVIIVYENIQLGQGLEMEYVKERTLDDGTPYDYASVLHYSGRTAGRDHLRVTLTKDPRFQELIGRFKDLSFYDYKQFNILYGCDKAWLRKCGLTQQPCRNEGFTGKACSCVCPPGTKGSKCENKIMSYNDAIVEQYAPLSERINSPGAIVQSPGYDKGRSDGISYVQVVEAPKCQRAILTFQDFQIGGRSDNCNECMTDSLEIRTDVTVSDGEIYCGEEVKKGQVFKSDNSMLILSYKLAKYMDTDNPYRGYKATFTTEPISGCTL